MSTTTTPLLPDRWYHIYNRGVNKTRLFLFADNYEYFLKLAAKYLPEVATISAYCLMQKHFHLLVYIKSNIERPPHRQFSHMFNSYAQAFNRQQNRTGSLFERPFRRKAVTSERNLIGLVSYIHCNPSHHGIMSDFQTYPYSSYHSILSRKPTALPREEVLGWFGGRQGFIDHHRWRQDDIDKDLLIE